MCLYLQNIHSQHFQWSQYLHMKTNVVVNAALVNIFIFTMDPNLKA